MSIFHYCPTCLNCKAGSDYEKFECDFCGAEMVSSGEDTLRKARLVKEKLKGRPEFNQKLFNARQRQVKCEYENRVEAQKVQELAGSKMVHCPACGSTQIQMVSRKWSLLAGFATNKVDRVCMKCKKKF